jgi:hypothetical protein
VKEWSKLLGWRCKEFSHAVCVCQRHEMLVRLRNGQQDSGSKSEIALLPMTGVLAWHHRITVMACNGPLL